MLYYVVEYSKTIIPILGIDINLLKFKIYIT